MKTDEYADESIRSSSPCLVHKLSTPYPLHDLQMLRELEIVNTRTRLELGPLPHGGTAQLAKRKPNLAAGSLTDKTTDSESKERDTMKIHHLATAAAVGLATGCTSMGHGHAGATSEHATANGISYGERVDRRYIRPKVTDGVLIMPFFDHNFGSACFDTLKCRVLYKNRYDTKEDEPAEPLTDFVLGNLSGGWLLDDFPSVARVTWTSKDGENHDEQIDLGEIFRSRLVRYAPGLDVNEVDLSVYYMTPDILLVVEDRSVSVYMKATIPLLKPVDPNNRYSDWRRDLVVAYTRRF